MLHFTTRWCFQIFLEFSPRSLGFHDRIWRAYFSDGLVQPPTRQTFGKFFWNLLRQFVEARAKTFTLWHGRVHVEPPCWPCLEMPCRNICVSAGFLGFTKIAIGGGFKLFCFHSETWGRWTHIWRVHFSDGLVQPPTRLVFTPENWRISPEKGKEFNHHFSGGIC